MERIYSSEEGARAVERRYRELLERWPMPAEHVRVPTAQGETFAVACGPADGPPLLLLHGSGATSAMWLPDVATWAARFRVYAVDLVGEPGLSAPSRPPLGSGAYAGWLEEVRIGLGLRRFSIVGVSLGGWMALDYATRRPENVERLALLCPSGIGRQLFLPLLGVLPLLLLGGEWGRRRAMAHILGPTAKDAPAGYGDASGGPVVDGGASGGLVADGGASGGSAANDGAAGELVASGGGVGEPVGNGELAEFALLIHRSFRPRQGRLPIFPDEALRRLTMPLLVVAGARDRMLDSRDTARHLAATVPGADVRLLPETGHLLPAQTRQIMNFLESTHG